MTFSAIIFDMDGVLVDTEPRVFEIFRSVFKPFGIHLSDEYQYRFIGKPFSANLHDIRRDFNIDFDDDVVRQIFDDAYARGLSSQPLPPQAGIVELIDRARSLDMKLALCTTTARNQVDVIFEQIRKSGAFNPRATFQAIVTGDDVTHRKPHPQPYLKAAAALGEPPAHCLVIEDTVTGVASAHAAGCPTAALRHPYNAHMDFSAADWLLDDLLQALSLI